MTQRSCLMISLITLVLAAGIFRGGPGLAAETRGSGLPLPRFVSLRAAEVNMRAGPSVRYPIEWVYQRIGLPVEVIAEFDTWRKVRDWQGSQGWLHQSMLSGQRTLIVTGKTRVLRQKHDPAAAAIARIEPGVLGKLLECPDGIDWCRARFDGHTGWLPLSAFWGGQKGEVLR